MAYPRRIEPETLCDVSLQLIDEEGFASLTVRAVADRLGVKAASLYRHMASFDELKFQLAERAANMLCEQLQRSLDRLNGGSAPARLAALAWAYVLWAEQFPGRYDCLAAQAVPGPGTQALRALIATEVGLLTGTDGKRGMAGTPPDPLATHALLAFLHGHVSLARCGLGAPNAGPDGFERGLVALLRGL